MSAKYFQSKKSFLLAILLFFLTLPLFGQVEDIKKKADKNKNRKERRDSDKNYSSGSSSLLADACLSGCFDFAIHECAWFVASVLVEHHSYLMENRENDPTVLSLDVMPHIAYEPFNEYINLLPRIRGTWGVLSTDLRFNYLADFKDFFSDVYITTSWQVIQINMLAEGFFNFRIGTGLLFENYTDGSIYNEHFLGLGFRFFDQTLLTTLEGRSAWSYKTAENIFYELNLRGAYRYFNTDHLYGYITFGILYQNYYPNISPSTDLLSIQTGLSFNIH